MTTPQAGRPAGRVLTRVTAATAASAAVFALAGVAPAQAAESSYRFDIDGDGKRDTITLTQRAGSDTQWTIRVRTARGATATTGFTTDGPLIGPGRGYETFGPVMGWGSLDGRPGSELVLFSSGGTRHSSDMQVYSWAGGRIVRESLPRNGVNWTTAYMWSDFSGFRFSTRKGVRYVEKLHGTRATTDVPFSTTIHTYRWTGKAWNLVGSRRTTVSQKAAVDAAQITGVRFTRP